MSRTLEVEESLLGRTLDYSEVTDLTSFDITVFSIVFPFPGIGYVITGT